MDLTDESVLKLDLNLFEEIKENLDKCVRFDKEEKEDRMKVETLDQRIVEGEKMAVKATEKKEILLRRNLMLKASLYEHEQTIKKSLNYWHEFGLDIQEVEGGYMLKYSKIEGDKTVSICLKPMTTQGRLEIFAQDPEILSNDQLNNLNNVRLTKFCKNNTIDYRGAMLEIKRELVKSLAQSCNKKVIADLETNSIATE